MGSERALRSQPSLGRVRFLDAMKTMAEGGSCWTVPGKAHGVRGWSVAYCKGHKNSWGLRPSRRALAGVSWAAAELGSVSPRSEGVSRLGPPLPAASCSLCWDPRAAVTTSAAREME